MQSKSSQREVQLKFRVTQEERALIEQKMEQLGTTNMAAYLRKMAMDGYAVNLELPELREMVSLRGAGSGGKGRFFFQLLFHRGPAQYQRLKAILIFGDQCVGPSPALQLGEGQGLE